MLCAEIHGKVSSETPAHDRMEDTLTSHVFSLFRYLKNMEIPAAFLRRARNIHNHNFPIEALAAGDVFFWPLFNFETSKSREPDAFLVLEQKSGEKVAVAVEAKFDSGLSNLAGEEPEPERETREKKPHKIMKNEANGLAIQFSHQLADEYCGIKCGNWTFNKINSIIEPKTFLTEAKRNKFLLYVTGSFELPTSDFREALEIIEDPTRCKRASAKCRQDAGEEIYWVSWRELSDVIEKAGLQKVGALVGADYSIAERCLISDVFQMLKIRGMYTFRPFQDYEEVSFYESLFLDKYFFEAIDPIERYESIFRKTPSEYP